MTSINAVHAETTVAILPLLPRHVAVSCVYFASNLEGELNESSNHNDQGSKAYMHLGSFGSEILTFRWLSPAHSQDAFTVNLL